MEALELIWKTSAQPPFPFLIAMVILCLAGLFISKIQESFEEKSPKEALYAISSTIVCLVGAALIFSAELSASKAHDAAKDNLNSLTKMIQTLDRAFATKN